MASVKFYNPKAFKSAAKRVREKRQRDFEKTLKMAVEYIFSHTPVWSGNTLANYRFSSIRASHEYTPHGVKKNFGEVNRAEAEKQAWSNFNRAKKDPDRPFFISNNTVYKEWRTGKTYTFSDFEKGKVSKSVPPTGIFYGAQQYVSARLAALK